MQPLDPLYQLFINVPVRQIVIDRVVRGEHYVAVAFNNGQIGVCATLGVDVTNSSINPADWNKNDAGDRLLISSCCSAYYNYQNDYKEQVDIFDRIQFDKYKTVVMVGYFESLYKKFEAVGARINVFDLDKKADFLQPINEIYKAVSSSDAVIVTGTTLSNNTLSSVLGAATRYSDVFVLGPSTIMAPGLFMFDSLKVLFGSVFQLGDERVLQIIADGGGTQAFSKYMKKVYLKRPGYGF